MEWNFDFFTFEVAIKGKLQEMERFFFIEPGNFEKNKHYRRPSAVVNIN